MTKRDTLTNEFERVIETLKTEYQAEKIIVFGSFARGETTPGDVDIVVLKTTDVPFFDRLREVALLCKWRQGFDVLVYTPREFARMCEQNAFVKNEIMGKGKVVYDRAA